QRRESALQPRRLLLSLPSAPQAAQSLLIRFLQIFPKSVYRGRQASVVGRRAGGFVGTQPISTRPFGVSAGRTIDGRAKDVVQLAGIDIRHHRLILSPSRTTSMCVSLSSGVMRI